MQLHEVKFEEETFEKRRTVQEAKPVGGEVSVLSASMSRNRTSTVGELACVPAVPINAANPDLSLCHSVIGASDSARPVHRAVRQHNVAGR